MLKIQYTDHTVNVPTSWDDVTVGDYEGFYLDRPETARERVALVAKICHVDPQVLFNWPAEIFDKIVDTTAFMFEDNPAKPDPSIIIGGVAYIVPIEDKLSLGAWVDAGEVQKEGVAVLSGVLAIVCRPVGEAYDSDKTEARAAMFAALPVSKVQGVIAFFLLCSDLLEKRTRAFLALQQVAEQLPRSIKIFPRPGGGIKLLLILRAAQYSILTARLRFQLAKLLRLFNTAATSKTPTRPKMH